MENITITARTRQKQEKPNALRREGLIPAVVYGKEFNALIALNAKDFNRMLRHDFSENAIMTLKIDDSQDLPVLLKEIQRDVLSGEVIHCDFVKVFMDKKIKVKIPVEVKGEAPGVKEGGILELFMHEIEVECLPKDIPENIEIDISSLNAGKSVHIKDIAFGAGIKPTAGADEVVLAIVSAAKEEAEEETGTEEEAEPEVIKEKPKEENT